MKDFRDLLVWQKAHKFTLDIHLTTRRFPVEERYGLTCLLCRSAASMGANLAEGCGRYGDGDFSRFVQIAMGSASETEYHCLLAHDLGMLNSELYNTYSKQIQEIKKMLASLLRKLRAER